MPGTLEGFGDTGHGKCPVGEELNLPSQMQASLAHHMFYHRVVPEWASLIAQSVNHLPAMQETRVRPLGQEDPLEKKMATHSSILAWEIPWTEEPGGL